MNPRVSLKHNSQSEAIYPRNNFGKSHNASDGKNFEDYVIAATLREKLDGFGSCTMN